MENWPENVLINIFDFLELEDLANVRDVCKRFRWICSHQIEIDELVVSTRTDDYQSLWGFSEKPIYYRDAISLNKMLSWMELFSIEQHLRRLHVREFSNNKKLAFDCSILTRFVQLQQLDLEIELGFAKQTINSRSLQVMSTLTQNCLTLETPNLMGFKRKHLNKIKFVYPEKLKVLEASDYEAKFSNFVNLECLILAHGGALNSEILTKFESLRELRVHYGDTARFDKLKETLINISKQKLVQRRLDFKLFIQGIEVSDVNNFIDTFPRARSYHFQINNYLKDARLLCRNLSIYTEHKYTELMELVGNQLPDDFTVRFYNIRKVTTSGKVHDENHFIGFLKSVNLESLHVKHSVLSQSFFNRLTDCQRLSKLKVEDNINLQLNYGFLLRFKLLEEFFTDQRSADLMSVASRAFQERKYLKIFETTNPQFSFRIDKTVSVNNSKKKLVKKGFSIELSIKSHDLGKQPNKISWGRINLINLIRLTSVLGDLIYKDRKYENNYQ